jgi:hypothetical protein
VVKANPAERRWIIEKIRDDGWEDAALSAAYHCQVESLHLKPWQPPPMWADEDRPRDDHPSAGKVAAWELCRRLLKAGLSMYEPDPIRRCSPAR